MTKKNNHFYEAHAFVCINERVPDHPRGSCSASGGVQLHAYMKKRAKELGIKNIRINKAGCLDRCELGPVIVIYPEGIWYHIEFQKDIEDVLQQHIIEGNTVERLVLNTDQKSLLSPSKDEISVEVGEVKRQTSQIKSFELHSVSGKNLPPFAAGSHIDITLGNGKKRPYSIYSNPEKNQKYGIAVLEEPEGRGGSKWIHQNLIKGFPLTISAPKNNFELCMNASSHLFIAGGIGITPIISMGHYLKAYGERAFLHYCTRSKEQTAFSAEVKELFGDNLMFHHDGGDASKGIPLDKLLEAPADGQHLYICGPKGLIDSALRSSSHWPKGTVHFELFSSGELKTSQESLPFRIFIPSRNITLDVPPHKSILEVVRGAGIITDSSCEGGVCGTCKVKLLSGHAIHKDNVLTDKEKLLQQDIMICVSRANGNDTLTLDL